MAASFWYMLLSLAGLVLIQSFRELVTSIYYHSLVDMGISPTVMVASVFLAPLSAIPLSRYLNWKGALLFTGAFTALARLPMGLGLEAPFQMVFSALAFSGSSTFLILALSLQRRERSMDPDVFSSQGAAGALSLSLLMQTVLVAAGSGLDASVVPEATGILLSPSLSALLSGSIGTLLYLLRNAPLLDPERCEGGKVGERITGGAVDSRVPFIGLGSFMALSVLVLPHPAVPSLWLGTEPAMTYSLSLLATSLFVLSLFTSWKPLIGLRISFAPPKGSVIANVVLVGAAMNMFIFRYPVPIAPAGLTWLALVDLWLVLDTVLDTEPFAGEPVLVDAGTGSRKYIGLRGKKGSGRNPDVLVRRMVISTGVLLLFPVLVIVSLNSAFVPGGDRLDGLVPVFMLTPALLLALSGFMCSKRGIYEPCLPVRAGHLPSKGSPALAAGSGSGHPVRQVPSRRRLGNEWIVMGFLTALLVILGTALIYSQVDEGPKRPETSPSTIVAMTYNIHQGFNNDGRADPVPMVNLIEEADPDILFLQESQAILPSGGNYDLPGLIAGRMGMDIERGPSPWEGTYGISILSRFPLYGGSVTMLTSTTEQKYFMTCKADLGGPVLTLVCVHLGQDEVDRPVQTLELASALKNMTGPVLIGGDFNSGPDDPLMARFNDTLFGQGGVLGPGGNTSRTLDLVSGWHCSSDREPSDIGTHTWPASDLDDERVHIDYILMSSDMSPLSARIWTDKGASDHRPVIVTVDMGRVKDRAEGAVLNAMRM